MLGFAPLRTGTGLVRSWRHLFLRLPWLSLSCLLIVHGPALAADSLRITELAAAGRQGLRDEDGETPDWIELQNASREVIDMADWQIREMSRRRAVGWPFPNLQLSPGHYLVVFASGKNRRTPGRPLHTNFKLPDKGGIVELRGPDGESFRLGPYPQQVAGVSYGLAGDAEEQEKGHQLLARDFPLRFFPAFSGRFATQWTRPDFDDSSWFRGRNGIGYSMRRPGYGHLLQTDLGPLIAGRTTGLFLRIPFVLDHELASTDLTFRVAYDDGFVAWLNGTEIARRNAPDAMVWNSASTATRDDLAGELERVPIANAGRLSHGTNWLAVHVLNASLQSSDLLFVASLERPDDVTPNAPPSDPDASYLARPTPGRPNSVPVHTGPQILSLTHQPEGEPDSADPIRVTAIFATNSPPPHDVQLHYRVMFDAEVVLPMRDNGDAGDDTAGDGTYSASLPAGIAKPGQMLRYFVVARDRSDRASRWPLFADRDRYSSHQGIVVHDSGIHTRLPVLHIFSESRNSRDLDSRVAIFSGGEFHDNVMISPHGQYSRSFPKRSYNVDFPRDHRFAGFTNGPRLDGLKLLSNYADKSRIRNSLAYEVISASGSHGHYALPVRIQRNGRFFSIAEAVEDGDDRWLERIGRDPEGALYKMYDNLRGTHGAEKKTRDHEDSRDLGALVRGLSLDRPIEQRVAFAYENLDLPQCISYLVALTLIGSDDHGHKNYYLYRDSRRTGEWALLPWDVDLSWGRNWTGQYFDETIHVNNPLDLYRPSQGKPRNPLYDLLTQYPDFRQMYLRRLRTVMDELLQHPDTPVESLILERRVTALVNRIDPPDIQPSDASLDAAAWPAWGRRRTAREEATRIIEEYLPGRRRFLFNSPRANLGGERIPASQPVNVPVQLAEISVEPDAGVSYIRVSHAHRSAIDLSRWNLSGAGIQFEFRPGTVIPAGKSLYVVGDIVSFRAETRRRGETARFVQGNWRGDLRPESSPLILADIHGRVICSTMAHQPADP
jgi:hypothetical protein